MDRMDDVRARRRAAGGLGMGIGRLEAFSDGVLAIVVTLLILEIQVPHAARGQLAAELGRQWPEYVAYLGSFLVVGTIWLNHHATFQLLARADHPIQLANLGLLLTTSVLPFPTELIATYTRTGSAADGRVAVAVYGGAMTLMSLAFTVLWRLCTRRPGFLKPEVTPELLAVRNSRYRLGLPVYPAITLLGLLSTPLFLGLNLAMGLLYLAPTPDVAVEGVVGNADAGAEPDG